MKYTNNLELVKRELERSPINESASNPLSPVSGQVYKNTTDDHVYFYNGTTWLDITDEVVNVIIDDVIRVGDDPYNSTIWDDNYEVPTKNAIRDVVESIIAIPSYNDENAQDAIGNILNDSSTIDLVYNDGSPSIIANVIESGLNLENLSGELNLSQVEEIPVQTILGNTTGGSASPLPVELSNKLEIITGTLQVVESNFDLANLGGDLQLSQIQDISEQTLLGNPIGFPSNIQEITLSNDFNFAASQLNVNEANLNIELLSGNLDFSNIVGDVELSQIESIPVQSILGNSTGGTSSPSAIVLGDGLEITGGLLNVTFSEYTNENAQDSVGNILSDTSTINLIYDDSIPNISADVIESGIDLANLGGLLNLNQIEAIPVNSLIANSLGTSSSPQTIELGDGLEFSSGYLNVTFSPHTDEEIQDIIGGILTDSSTIDFTYDDITNIISGSVIESALSLSANQIVSDLVNTARLGSGTANSTTFLRGDQTWQTVSMGLTVGSTTISSGTNDRILYQSGGNLAQSDRFIFDGTDLKLINPTVATIGTQTQNSPYLYLQGTKWRIDTGVSEDVKTRIKITPQRAQYDSVLTPKFMIDSWSQGGSDWMPTFGFEALDTDYLTTRFRFGSPITAGWGAFLDVNYDGGVQWKRLNGTPAPLVFTTGGSSPSGFPTFGTNSFYQPELRSYFGSKILFAAGYPGWEGTYSEGANASGTEFVQSNLPITIGGTVNPTGYKLEVVGESKLSGDVLISDTYNINFSTSTGTIIGETSSQKFAFWGATPTTQRTNIGIITDSTGGTPGITINIDDGFGALDYPALNDALATIIQRLNRIETIFQEIGITN